MNRVLTAAVGVPLILAATYWAPDWGFALFVALVAAAALEEFFQLRGTAGLEHPGRWFLPFGALVTLAFVWELEGIVGAFMFAIAVLAVVSASRGIDVLREHIITATAGIVYICLLLGFLIWIPRSAVFVLLGIIWIGDTAAFYVGRAVGRNHLAPYISPNKTIEGAVAGLLGSLLVGVFLGRALLGLPFGLLIVLSLVTAVAGQIGDLTESRMKRKAGVKDSGTLLPGHGGVLDRIDSLLLATPVFFLLARFP